MKNKWVWTVALTAGFVGFGTGKAFASAEVDNQYAFRAILAMVINTEPDNLHAQNVQTAMDKYFESRPRFDLSTTARESARQWQAAPAIADLNTTKEDELLPWLSLAAASGADCALLAQVQKLGDEYQIAFVGAVAEPAEVVFRRVVPVRDRFSLNSFTLAADEGLNAFAQSLPFDSTVVSREGYRVVFDRGAPSFKQGTRVPVFTLEKDALGISLVETGVVAIQRVDANLAFGKIQVENKPLEVAKGNKARFQTVSPMVDAEPTRSPKRLGGPSRSIASIAGASTADYVFRKEKLGNVEADLAGSLVTWNRTAVDGTLSSSRAFYPGASLRAQVKLTEDTYGELGGMFGAGTLGSGLSSQTNQVRLQVGYRMSLGESGLGPSVHLRVGYSRTQFQVDDQPTVLGPSSAVFGGLAMGGGFTFPFSETFGVGLDMTGLAFVSLSEGGGTSGASSRDLSAWDFAVRGYYHLNSNVNLQAKLLFQTHTAGFSGQGTRTVAVSSLSQSTSALLTGISYAF